MARYLITYAQGQLCIFTFTYLNCNNSIRGCLEGSLHVKFSPSSLTPPTHTQRITQFDMKIPNLVVTVGTLSVARLLQSYCRMVNDMQRVWNEAAVTWSGYYSGIFLKGLRKTTKNVSFDSRCPGRDSNWAPPKFKPRTLYLNERVRRRNVVITIASYSGSAKFEYNRVVRYPYRRFSWFPSVFPEKCHNNALK
jgi:hypothetical protein